MFTGIVEELGTVVSLEDQGDAVRLTVNGPLVTSDAGEGDSIAVNGCCLTVVTTADGSFTADVMHETLAKTSLGAFEAGTRVNLERAVTPTTRLGGHIVQGHVDGVGSLRGSSDGLTWFDAPGDVLKYCVEKGSIAVDGTSLTVAGLDDRGFAVALIPTTLEATTLGALEPGDAVNLEADVIGKYVERLTMNR
jgi:riboflavin synthase